MPESTLEFYGRDAGHGSYIFLGRDRRNRQRITGRVTREPGHTCCVAFTKSPGFAR
jgi:hypothetical protein